MGKKGGGESAEPSPQEILQARINREFFNNFGRNFNRMLGQGATRILEQNDPFATSLQGAERDILGSQFNQARSGILANAPSRGGALQASLMGAEIGRAGASAQADLAARQRGLDRAFQLATGMVPNNQTIASAAALGNQTSLANLQASQAQAANQKSGLGALAGLGTAAIMAF